MPQDDPETETRDASGAGGAGGAINPPRSPAPDLSDLSDLRAALAEHRAGRRVEAERVYRRVVASEPDGTVRKAHALHLLGLLARDCGHTKPAADLLEKAVAQLPAGDPSAAATFRSNLAAVLWDLNRRDEALGALREAVRLDPAHVDAQANLAAALERAGRAEEAVAAFRRLIELRPGHAHDHARLGTALRSAGRLGEAEAEGRGAVELYRAAAGRGGGDAAGEARAWVALAATLAELGRVEESVEARQRAVQLQPGWSSAHSDLLLALHYTCGDDPRFLYEAHREWARRHAAPLYPSARPHGNDRSPGRRLRVGYVSPDLRAHPVGRLFEPLLAGRDREHFGAFCYSDTDRPDAFTRRLRALADGWHDTSRMSHEAAADLIRGDGIDVLVDLGGHMDNARLPMLARKPAPVQVAYLGYPDTTGVETIDYRITDAVHDPPGETERYHTEELVRLDPCCWCYRADDDAPEVGELPALQTGGVTFAALNRMAKTTPQVLGAWSRVLEAVPGSRLMVLVARGAEAEPGLLGLFARGGIDPARVALVGRRSRRDYLRLYHGADVCLDTFPYAGHTTTLDALWMGVPTVSLAGRTHVARAGLSVLSAVGLGELAVATVEQYVEVARGLASDLPRLAELRRGLRRRVADSPLADARGLAARLEAAFREMWRRWCEGEGERKGG